MTKTRHILLGLIACALTILMFGMGLLSSYQAYAASADTEVSLSSDLNPLVLVSRSPGEQVTITEGDDLGLEAIFSGGEGAISYTWAVSYDDGSTFLPLSTSTTNTYEITDAKLHPQDGSYIYRLYAKDSSIQRLEVRYTVKVMAKDNPGPTPKPTPTPPTPDPSPSPDPNTYGSGTGAKTSDVLGSLIASVIGLLLSALIVIFLARKMQHSTKARL